MTWGKVYEVLALHDVSVVGGRFADVGVAGLVLSGGDDHFVFSEFCADGRLLILGFSWKTSQYGLAIDNVLVFELVKPDGTAVNVTVESDPELFFGLKVSRANIHSVLGKLRISC